MEERRAGGMAGPGQGCGLARAGKMAWRVCDFAALQVACVCVRRVRCLHSILSRHFISLLIEGCAPKAHPQRGLWWALAVHGVVVLCRRWGVTAVARSINTPPATHAPPLAPVFTVQITVGVRLRPPTRAELESGIPCGFTAEPRAVLDVEKQTPYPFDYVWGIGADNAAIYRDIGRSIIESIIKGYNG
jgi:hypothetical protein